MGPIVAVMEGQLEGVDRGGVLHFAGVPFAAPPVGELRFAPAAPHPGWDGVRDATHPGKVAPQVPGTMETLAGAGPPDWDEDCLTLNVFTPSLEGARPVMVWIHGGGFTGGTGSIDWYDGTRLVERGDVVVVTINYRLGAFGWLYLDHLQGAPAGSGNAGLSDQMAALAWVRDNIASFGGDPERVTVFGESAGAMSVATLMGVPAAAAMFSGAVAQSGAAHNTITVAEATQLTDRVMNVLGVGDVAGLRAVDAATLLDAQTKAALDITQERATSPEGSGLGLPFGPVLDNVVLERAPLEAIAAGSAAHVALLCGTTAEEWRLFGMMLRSPEDEQTLLRRLGRMVEDPDQVAAVYRQAHDVAGHDALWNAIMTDRVFRIPAIRLAEAQARHQPDNTFMYLFEWASPAFDGALGSCHALEIPFVFDNLGARGVEIFTGPGAPVDLADAMASAWVAFANDSRPILPDGSDWPAYDTARRATMHLDAQSGRGCRVEHDPSAEARVAWDGWL
jgi:para-nitrobenzyl esterase